MYANAQWPHWESPCRGQSTARCGGSQYFPIQAINGSSWSAFDNYQTEWPRYFGLYRRSGRYGLIHTQIIPRQRYSYRW